MKYLSKDNDHFLNDTHQLFKTFYYFWDFRKEHSSFECFCRDCLHTLTPYWVLSLPFPVKLRAVHCIMTSDQKKSICNLI